LIFLGAVRAGGLLLPDGGRLRHPSGV
jgi:hypothetical protein